MDSRWPYFSGRSSWAVQSAAVPPPVEAFGRLFCAPPRRHQSRRHLRLPWISEEGDVAVRDHPRPRNWRKAPRRVAVPASRQPWRAARASDDTLLVEQTVTQTVGMSTPGELTQEYQRWIALQAPGGESRLLLQNDDDRRWSTGSHLRRVRTAIPASGLHGQLELACRLSLPRGNRHAACGQTQ